MSGWERGGDGAKGRIGGGGEEKGDTEELRSQEAR